MKKYLVILSSILIIISCDVEEGPFIGDYDSYINPEKKILIEDFTGHLCGNCPDAARELEAIHDIYGDQIIGMAIHVGMVFAKPHHPSQEGFQYDFRTSWGDNWDNYYGNISAELPKGMINRIGFPEENHKIGKDEWAATVGNELKKEIDFKINISSNGETISITTEAQNNTIGDYNLVVCLTESNISNWQKDGVINVENYIHNHVLRTVLIDQELSNNSSYNEGQIIGKTINYNLSSLEQYNIDYSENLAFQGNGNAGNWDANNMSVIAYIYNTSTKEIVQAEEAHLNN